jgi:hypothetical protein
VRRPIAVAQLAAALAATCGPSTSSSPPSLNGSSPPTAPVTLGPAETPLPTSGVVIDSRLLDVLPEAVDGFELVESPEAELAALEDPQLEAVAASIAAGIAVDAAGGEFVYAIVVGLLPGVMDANVLRDWRDSYDEGACSQADGVAGHAETEIGGRTVYIGTCVGDLRTYHVWLEEQEVLISASAVGERRLGERLVENLRP